MVHIMQSVIACHTTLLQWRPHTPLQIVNKYIRPNITKGTFKNKIPQLQVLNCFTIAFMHLLTTTCFRLTNLSMVSMEFKATVHIKIIKIKNPTLSNLTTPNTFTGEHGVTWMSQTSAKGPTLNYSFPPGFQNKQSSFLSKTYME